MSSMLESAQYSALPLASAHEDDVHHDADSTERTLRNRESRAVDLWRQKDLNTQLLAAIVARDLSAVDALLQRGAHPNTTCRSYKFSAVHLAVLVGTEDILRQLLAQGAACTGGDRHGLTPLHYASYYSHDRCMKLLLQHVHPRDRSSFLNAPAETCKFVVLDSVKDSLDHTCSKLEAVLPQDVQVGCTALHVACQKVHLKCVQTILQHNPSMLLKDARELTAFEVIGELLTVGETTEKDFVHIVNAVKFFCGKRESVQPVVDYSTPLHAAVRLASASAIKLLLGCGLDVETLDEAGETPVHLAIVQQAPVALKALLDCVPDVSDLRNALGLTPFQAAVERQWVHGIGTLLCADVNVTEVAADGRTVLHVAAAAGNVDLLEELFQLDDVHKILNTGNDIGESPIYCAIASGKLACVQFLIDRGVDITVRLQGNINVLHRAAEQGAADILAALLHVDRAQRSHLVDELDSRHSSGMTPLHMAAWNNHFECVRALVEYNCHYTKRTSATPHCGAMAVHLACTRDHSTVLQHLLEHKRQLSLVDNGMRNSLHCAAQHGSRKCIELLLAAGASLASVHADETALDTIFRNVSRPKEFLETLFDSRIRVDDERTLITDKECLVNINFDVLIPEHGNQMEILSNIVHTGRSLEQRKLLLHPLIECFLHLKWRKMSLLFWPLLLVYALFVLCLSLFAMAMFYFSSGRRPAMLYHVDVLRSALVLLLCLVSGLEILLVLRTGLFVQITLERCLKWLSLSLVFVLIWTPSAIDDHNWLRHIATLAVLTAWIHVMFLLAKVPKWGYYVQMFFKVSKNVLKVMAIFSVLVIGFALAFLIEFQCVESFAHPLVGLVKTIVMMTSELDYSGLFTDANSANAQAINLTIYLVFVVLASIVLMNLMVGLAVSDIHDLETIGKIDRHAQQIEFLAGMETATMAKYLPRCMRHLGRRNHVPSTFKVYPAQPKGTALPAKLKASIVDIAEENVRRGSAVTPAQLLEKMDAIQTMIEELQRQSTGAVRQ